MCQTSRFSLPCPLSVIPSVGVYFQKAVSPQTACARDQNVSRTVTSVAPTKPGYQFLGWSKFSTATSPSYNAGSSYSFDYGSIQLYAIWKQLSITVSGTPDSHAIVGNYWSFSPTVSVSGCSVSISGAPWLSATGTTVSGTPTQTGEYNVTLTFSKSGYTSETVDHGMDSYTNAFGPYENESECKDIVSYLKIKWMIDVGAPADHNTIALVKNMVNEYNIITGE